MTTNQLKSKIAEAVSLDRKINELTACLKEVKAELTMQAEGCPEEHTATENGGASWRAEGADGCACVVTFPAARLASAVDPETKKGATVLELVKGHKDELFTPRLDYVLVANFRDRIGEVLDKGVAKKVMKLLTSESAPRVSFETRVESEVAS